MRRSKNRWLLCVHICSNRFLASSSKASRHRTATVAIHDKRPKHYDHRIHTPGERPRQARQKSYPKRWESDKDTKRAMRSIMGCRKD